MYRSLIHYFWLVQKIYLATEMLPVEAWDEWVLKTLCVEVVDGKLPNDGLRCWPPAAWPGGWFKIFNTSCNCCSSTGTLRWMPCASGTKIYLFCWYVCCKDSWLAHILLGCENIALKWQNVHYRHFHLLRSLHKKQVILQNCKRHSACWVCTLSHDDRHTDTSENITFPHPLDAGGINFCTFNWNYFQQPLWEISNDLLLCLSLPKWILLMNFYTINCWQEYLFITLHFSSEMDLLM